MNRKFNGMRIFMLETRSNFQIVFTQSMQNLINKNLVRGLVDESVILKIAIIVIAILLILCVFIFHLLEIEQNWSS